MTREAFQVLRELYRSFGLRKTRLDRIYSEASLAKACFKEMGIPPWRELANEFPGELLGPLMSSQYGGRSEVHLHHEVVPVQLCDFRACYPAVSCLLRTFDFLRAGEVTVADATEAVQASVEEFEPEELRYPGLWRSLCVLVELLPCEDRLPVRAPYSGPANPQFTTALNYLSSEVPLWYALPDVLVSKLYTGRTPQILRAVRFTPGAPLPELHAIRLMGQREYRIDPSCDDFFARLGELRERARAQAQDAEQAGDAPLALRFRASEQALKNMANAACFGIPLEVRVAEHAKARRVAYYDHRGERREVRLRTTEQPGTYFNPLVATLATAGARAAAGTGRATGQARRHRLGLL